MDCLDKIQNILLGFLAAHVLPKNSGTPIVEGFNIQSPGGMKKAVESVNPKTPWL
jgi:hypothetical protein